MPLTHRQHAHGLVFVTGHAKPSDAGIDWKALAATAAQAKLTLVIYMGINQDSANTNALSDQIKHTHQKTPKEKPD